MNAPRYVHHQCLRPQGEPQPSPLPLPRDPPRPVGKPGPSSYKITAFALGPSAHEILCAPFKTEVSISPSLGAPAVKPASFQSQMLWGLLFPVPDFWAGGPNVRLRTCIPVGEPL